MRRIGEAAVEGPTQGWLEAVHVVQVAIDPQAEDRPHSIVDLRGSEAYRRLGQQFRLDAQGRKARRLRLLPANGSLVQSQVQL